MKYESLSSNCCDVASSQCKTESPPSEIEMLNKRIELAYSVAKELKEVIIHKKNEYFGLEPEKEVEIEAISLFCNMSVMLDYVEEGMKNALEYIRRV